MILQDKTVVVTGTSDGIGKEIAIKLHTQGCQLALIGRNHQKLENLQAQLPGAHIYACDITHIDALKETIDNILKDFPRGIDILINNAGIWQKKMQVDEIDETTILEVIHTNLIAHIQTTRLLLPHLRTSPEAAILNIVSRSGVTAQPGQSVYSASKWGMKGFTDVLQQDLKGSTVRVGAVYQGGTNTQLFEKAGENLSTDTFIDPADLADVVVMMLNRPPKIWLSQVHVES